MKGYQPMDSFGEATADIYDAEPRGDELSTVALLGELARGGPALELAIGTGRIALPLAARGIRVDGVDLAPAMVSKLRAKPGGEHLSITMGDFADVPVEGTYRLIFIVFNTLFNLLTQEDQVRCFENVAKHLTDDGLFVLEAFVPTFLTRLRDDQYVDAEHVGVDHVVFDVGRHDPVTQRLDESHVVLSPEGVRLFPIVTRYAWPSELDLMGRIAGLRLKNRWAGWDESPSPRRAATMSPSTGTDQPGIAHREQDAVLTHYPVGHGLQLGPGFGVHQTGDRSRSSAGAEIWSR